MRFIAYAKVHGQCCDYGWGTRGNAKMLKLKAEDIEEAMAEALRRFQDILGGGERTAESITVYAIADEIKVNIDRTVAENIARAKEREAKMEEAVEKARYEQLKKRFG